jgi:transposase
MQHLAIDLGGRESQLCVRATDGSIVKEARVSTKSLPKLLTTMEPSRVILETSAEAFKIADAALAHGHEVRVVPATLVKQLGVGARGVKNDRKDAQVLSEVSCRIDLPSVHIPSETSRQLKSLCGSREAMLRSRTLLINNVRGWLRAQLARIRTGATHTFPRRVREHAQQTSMELPPHVEQLLTVIETINEQVKEADAQLAQIASKHPVCHRLMTTPGVGPVTAVRYLAALDDMTRFSNAHAVQSYLGLTPGENSSSERKRNTGITKAGPSELRRTLIQAAWAAFRRCPNEPMVQWAKQIELRRGKFIAVVALARKLAGILFAMWRDGTPYRSSRSASPMTV